MKYYSIVTAIGKKIEEATEILQVPMILDQFVIGDGNGMNVIPDESQKKLVNEVFRGKLSALNLEDGQINQYIATISLPDSIGDFTIREVGLLTNHNILFAVANCPMIEKTTTGMTVEIKLRFNLSSSISIKSLKITTEWKKRKKYHRVAKRSTHIHH